jgi:hypothetical protein
MAETEPTPPPPGPWANVPIHGDYVVQQYQMILERLPDGLELRTDSDNVAKYGEPWLVTNLTERAGNKPG